MAVSRETLRLLAGMRLAINGRVDAATRDFIRAWARAWNEVATEWQTAITELVAASDDGRWPTRLQIARAERAQRALDATRAALADLRDFADVRLLQEVPELPAEAAEWHARIVASQMPASAAADTAALTARFNRVDRAALEAIVERTTQQITALTLPLAADASAVMQAELIRGVAIGDNPRRAAARMLERVRGAFDGGLNRALVIARTEMLDAHRAGGWAQDMANLDVLAGWKWAAQLDTRTCPSCWARHGTLHEVHEAGPLDHQQGRCSRLPVTKSWRDLGFDLDEPADLLPDARAVFDALPEGDQLAVMGAQRLELLRSGQASWQDLSRRRETPGWRDSFAPAPVKDLMPRPRLSLV